MGLFKILKGDSSRISTDITPFTEGYAYFTPDDGAFYIDAVVDGKQVRMRINPEYGGPVKPVEAELLADGWVSSRQVLHIPEITKDISGIIGLSQDITEDEMEVARNAAMYVCGQSGGSITIAVFGETPKVNIPVTVLLMS